MKKGREKRNNGNNVVQLTTTYYPAGGGGRGSNRQLRRSRELTLEPSHNARYCTKPEDLAACSCSCTDADTVQLLSLNAPVARLCTMRYQNSLAWSLLDSGFRERRRDREKAGERTPPRDHGYIRLYNCTPPICILRVGHSANRYPKHVPLSLWRAQVIPPPSHPAPF